VKGWPYCQHPECHNARTHDYADNYGNGSSSYAGSPNGKIAWFGIPRRDDRGVRRWCHTHALIFEGVAIGGPS
jgi:hypothetical protein